MTKFADMPIGQKNRWLAWANNHDWGSTKAHWATDDANVLVAYSMEYDANDVLSEVPARFDNPRDLRAWAGY